MAFFRKKQQATDGGSDRRADAMDADSQAKWDELERLVSTQAEDKSKTSTDHAPENTSFETSPSEFTHTATAVNATSSSLRSDNNVVNSHPSNEFGGHDLRNLKSNELASDLRVDLAEDSNFIDVTPEISTVNTLETKPVMPSPSITAMMPSESQRKTRPLGNADTETKSSIHDTSSPDYTPPPPAVRRPDRADIGAMRLDVARISADIQSGEELYRRAQQRIENLTGFVERAEIDFSMLNRLEPENRRLKARNRTIEREIDATNQKINVLRADLKDREQRLAEKSRVYEETVGKLSTVQKSLQEYERALNTTRESSDRNALNSERLQTSLDVERRENEVLRTRLSDVVGEIDSKQTAYIEAKKVADSLAQDCADFRHQAETAEKDTDSLRKSLAIAQTQNNAMKAEMMGLHEDIRTFKTQSEFTIISREDELTALQQQVSHLTKQLDIKDEIVRNAARDVQELRKIRTAQDLERERLEAHIQTQSFQLEQASSDLLQSKQDVTDFDRRYRDVATALSVSQARRMSNEPAETPDIQPVTQPSPQPIAPPVARDEFDNLSDADVEDRIMDFRLGIRNDIT